MRVVYSTTFQLCFVRTEKSLMKKFWKRKERSSHLVSPFSGSVTAILALTLK